MQSHEYGPLLSIDNQQSTDKLYKRLLSGAANTVWFSLIKKINNSLTHQDIFIYSTSHPLSHLTDTAVKLHYGTINIVRV